MHTQDTDIIRYTRNKYEQVDVLPSKNQARYAN